MFWVTDQKGNNFKTKIGNEFQKENILSKKTYYAKSIKSKRKMCLSAESKWKSIGILVLGIQIGIHN